MSDAFLPVQERPIQSIPEKALRRLQQARKNLEQYESPDSGPEGLVGYAASIGEQVKALVDARLGQRLDELPEGSNDGRAEAIYIYRMFRRGEELETVVSRLRELEKDAPQLAESVDQWIRKELMKEILCEKPEPVPPPGWEGSYAEPVDTLADLVAWLNEMIRLVELLTGPGGWTQQSNLHKLRNAHRLIDKLGLMGMPSLPAEALTRHAELSHLRRLRKKCLRRLQGQDSRTKEGAQSSAGSLSDSPMPWRGEALGPSEAGNRISVTEAAQITGVNKGTLWRAARKGDLKNNGLKGRAFCLDAADLTRWTLERARKPESAESAASVKRKVKLHVRDYRD